MLNLRQCLLNIGEDIFNIFNTNRKTNQIGSNTSLKQLLLTELTMGMTCRVQHTST